VCYDKSRMCGERVKKTYEKCMAAKPMPTVVKPPTSRDPKQSCVEYEKNTQCPANAPAGCVGKCIRCAPGYVVQDGGGGCLSVGACDRLHRWDAASQRCVL
jgi:hypothetical protein